MANYIISWDKTILDEDKNIITEKHQLSVGKCTKREIDKIVDELALNLNYSNITLERID